MKEKRQAMEMYDKESKELQQFISKLQPAKEIITQSKNTIPKKIQAIEDMVKAVTWEIKYGNSNINPGRIRNR